MQTEQLQVTTPDRDFGVLPIILPGLAVVLARGLITEFIELFYQTAHKKPGLLALIMKKLS